MFVLCAGIFVPHLVCVYTFSHYAIFEIADVRFYVPNTIFCVIIIKFALISLITLIKVSKIELHIPFK